MGSPACTLNVTRPAPMWLKCLGRDFMLPIHAGPAVRTTTKFLRDLAQAIRQRATIRHYIDGDGLAGGAVEQPTITGRTRARLPNSMPAHHLSVMIVMRCFMRWGLSGRRSRANSLGPALRQVGATISPIIIASFLSSDRMLRRFGGSLHHGHFHLIISIVSCCVRR